MYKTKKFGVVSCELENQILAKLERDLSKKRRHKHKRSKCNKDKKPDN